MIATHRALFDSCSQPASQTSPASQPGSRQLCQASTICRPHAPRHPQVADGMSVGTISDSCLECILAHIPDTERHSVAACVCTRWHDICVLLALRQRAQPNGQQMPAVLPMLPTVSARVQAAKEQIDPEAAPQAWFLHGYGAVAANRNSSHCCVGVRRVPTFDVTSLDSNTFQRDFAGRRPVLITGLAESWPATRRWRLDVLWRNENYSGALLRVGDAGNSEVAVKISLRDYLQYLVSQQDDDPLYLFDEEFAQTCPAMLDDYSVPDYLLADDVLSCYPFDFECSSTSPDHLENVNRPNASKQAPNPDSEAAESHSPQIIDRVRPKSRKWLLIGPRGSGTDVHTDPPGTSAWNSVVHGAKRWAFIDSNVPESVILGPSSHYEQGLPASEWFMSTLPEIVRRYPESVQEVVQLPGSMIYIPDGCWHAVWNVEDTVAVTHNSIARRTFDEVFDKIKERVDMKFLCKGESVSHTERQGKIVRKIDRYFGFRSPKSTLSWCQSLRGNEL